MPRAAKKPDREAMIYGLTHTVPTQLVAIERALYDAGLIATARRVNEASREFGWEAEREVTAIRKGKKR